MLTCYVSGKATLPCYERFGMKQTLAFGHIVPYKADHDPQVPVTLYRTALTSLTSLAAVDTEPSPNLGSLEEHSDHLMRWKSLPGHIHIPP